MKKFLSRLSLFLSILLMSYFITIIFIIYLNKLLINDCRLNDDVNTLIIGDSHTMWSIDDKEMNKVQNISLNAEGYFYTYVKLKYILEHEKNIEYIYLGFSYHNLSAYYDDYIYGKRSLYFFFRYIDILDIRDYLTLISHNPRNIIEMGPVFLRKGIPGFVSKNCDFIGYFPSEAMLDTFRHDQLKKRINEQYYINDKVLSYSDINITYLKEIIGLCKEKHINLIMLTTPLNEKYCQLVPEKFLNAYEQIIQTEQLKVYNFKDLVLPDSCFLPDADHVNYYGAILTSKKFKEFHDQMRVIYSSK